jgi:hypothetical protein
MRAVAASEQVGVPAIGVVSSGFEPMARALAPVFGVAEPRLAVYPGAVQTDTQDVFEAKVRDVVVGEIIAGLTGADPATVASDDTAGDEPSDPRAVVLSGTYDEVQEHFLEMGWSDGLPVTPPTPDRVAQFLDHTDLDPATVFGVLDPEGRELTVRSLAVNGVMAGCRPEYMPLLVAIAECLVDPRYRLEDLVSTHGFEPLVVVSGPVVERFDFNDGTGAMRVGRRANSSVGRFVRLVLRNVAGLRIPPGEVDPGAIGASFMVAMAENDAATREIGWDPFRVDNGFSAEVSTVSLLAISNHSAIIFSSGETAEDHLQTFARILGNAIGPWAYTATVHDGFNPLILMSPYVAQSLQAFGYGKAEIRAWLHEHMHIPAGVTEAYARQVGRTAFSFDSVVTDPDLRTVYVESDDPDRLVPVIMNPDWNSIVIGGNPSRNQSRGNIGNLTAGPPVTKVIALPPG